MAMSISQFVHQHPDHTHNTYRITFFEHTIDTVVTHTPTNVDNWISEIERHHNLRPHQSILVGLDVEWRPNQTPNVENPVATVQLCIGRSCLIFQILRSAGIPRSLVNFLGNPSYVFSGVGIENDVGKLSRDYNLVVTRTVDLRVLAANKYGERELMNAGLQQLSIRVLGREISKPKGVTMSRWDDQCLNPMQVQYAAIDAFLSYEIGRILITGNGN